MPEPRPTILQIMPAPAGMRVRYPGMEDMELEALGLALVQRGEDRVVEPLVHAQYGIDVASWLDDHYRIVSEGEPAPAKAGTSATDADDALFGAEENDDDFSDGSFDWTPDVVGGLRWPTLDLESMDALNEEKVAPDPAADPNGLFAPAYRHARREARLMREAVSFPPRGRHVWREIDFAGELMSALASLPEGLRVIVSSDGRRFCGLEGLGLFVPPRTSLLERPVVYLLPRGEADDWRGWAEEMEDPPRTELEIIGQGRDFADELEVLAAWNAEETFTVLDVAHPDHGRSVTRRSLRERGVEAVLCRFDQESRTTVLLTDGAT
jgi:hypothetical protein